MCGAKWGGHTCNKPMTQHCAFHTCMCGHWILTPNKSCYTSEAERLASLTDDELIQEAADMFQQGNVHPHYHLDLPDINFGIDKEGFVWNIWNHNAEMPAS